MRSQSVLVGMVLWEEVRKKCSQVLREIATKNQRKRGHGREIDFAHTLPV